MEQTVPIGIGVDIERIARFEGLDREQHARFFARVFSKREQTYCYGHARPAQHFAARFAAKEAVSKALAQLGFSDPISYADIQILSGENEKPIVHLPRRVPVRVQVSLSHDSESAIASALVFSSYV